MNFSVNLYFIKGCMLGFEMVDLGDDEKYLVFDMFILRVYIEY